jgi:hypothetical protein
VCESFAGLYNGIIPTYVTQGYRERELSSKLTSFTLSGLQPGETYGIQLKTKVTWIFFIF